MTRQLMIMDRIARSCRARTLTASGLLRRLAAGKSPPPPMNDTTSATILRVIARAPQWVRHDLEAKDDAIRTRAEEMLAAMIANTLEPGTEEPPQA